jgi:hypothetical protein
MLAALVNSGRYMGIERSAAFLAEIEREQVTQRSGAIDDNQISAIGRQFGVKYVCIADITPAFGTFQVSARIVNVETAAVVFIGDDHSTLETMDELNRVSTEVVRRMFGIEPLPPQARTVPSTIFSAGIGGFFAGDFGGGLTWTEPEKAHLGMPGNGWGAYLFFDAKYAEVFVGFSSRSGAWKAGSDADSLPNMQRTYINFGAFAKYPIPLSSNLKAYPLLGFDYEMSIEGRLRYTDGREFTFDGHDDRLNSSALSALRFKAGAGVEISIGLGMYLRPEILYGVRTANAFEKNEVDFEKEYDRIAKPRLGHGLTLRLGGGFRF